MTSDYVIRTMTRSDMDFAIAAAQAEGWNPGAHDADCFYAADAKGFLIGELGGEPVSCISCVSYGGTFGFIGLYIVRAEYRGKGLGLAIWKEAIKRLEGHTIGLDGVVAQQDNYRRSGFRLAHRNIRYQGNAVKTGYDTAHIIPLDMVDFALVDTFDRTMFPAPRTEFLRTWVAMPDSSSFGFVENGILRGFGTVRQCGTGYKIGPLYAREPDYADEIFRALAGSVPIGVPLYLDVPETNARALRLAARYNMKKVFETARMYTAAEPEFDHGQWFGVTSFELG